ncbi:uncharacterized protein LOC116298715 [Actinia tenebrosa]|uniref:Uncharacterized protein LOC116298715 n=1 Tax=Actinia tenebrosa TaxID=6105 RepID=A0A6P8IBY3_ACTTE|nr:uncharacterized protein LOC116298715 [Actinia tenebrosa]
MLSFRQRLRERWHRGGENVGTGEEGDESAIHLRVGEGTPDSTLNGSSQTSSLSEQKISEETSAEMLHFIVDFVGSSAISEAQSVQILSETLKRVKKQQLRAMRVDFTIRDGILKVSCVESNALLLTAPLYAIALCAQEQLRGFDNCFALNITRKRTHMCHVFQAGSCLEAASVVRSVAVAFKTIGRLLREKRDKEQRQKRSTSISSADRTRTNSEASTVTSVEEALRASQRRHKLFREKMDRESVSESVSVGSSSRISPRSKQTRSFPKSSTSPFILRHTAGMHSSGRHVEFSALSPVPSDSSDTEGAAPVVPVNIEPSENNEETESKLSPKSSPDIRVTVDVHSGPPFEEKEQIPDARELVAKTASISQLEEGNAEVNASMKEQAGTTKEPVSPSAELSLPLTLETNFFLDEDENFKPALEAVLRGDVAAVEKYLDNGMSENASDNNQKSLLFHAVSMGQAEVAQFLLRRGAEVNWEGPEDKTPLHIAATEGNRTATQMLLSYGANVRAKDNAFCTPLHLSVGCKQNLEVSHLLVEHGARINDNSLQGVRPVDLEPQLKEMQRLLVQSACEAFTAADLSKSRSNSNASSHNQPTAAGSFRSKAASNQSPRLERINSLRNGRLSSSMCSIPRGGLVRSSTEGARGIKRSESIHVSRMLSPQLGRGKRPLRRSLSFQRYPADHKFQLEINARIEANLRMNTTDSHGTDEKHGNDDNYIPQVTKKRSNSDLARYSTEKVLPCPEDVMDLTKNDDGLSIAGNVAAGGKERKDDTVGGVERPVSPANIGLERKRKAKSVRQHSIESEHSGGGHHSSECEDSSYMSSTSHGNRDEDPIIEALKSVVLLSGNPECHASLLAYLCLPRASSQLISLSHMPMLTAMVAENIALLIGNLFNLEGPESRKRSVEAGLIKTVLKLVDGVEPIQSTCLSILHNILDFDNDREYSAALQSIPVEPLLNLLHISDNDSAFDMRATDSPPPYTAAIERGRRRKASTCSRGSHDDWHSHRELSPGSVQRNNSGASDGRPEMRRIFQKRSSISSMASSAEGDQYSLYSSYGHGHLPWSNLCPDMYNKNLPRLVATKMLAATTMNAKMQKELGKERPMTLMLETLQDSNHDIVVYTTAALANIAMNIDNHMQMKNTGCVDAMKHLLSNSDPRITYHAARCLIYLGHMEVNGIYLFKHITREDKIDVIFADTTGSEHLYVKGATVEKIVEIATNNPSILWGGTRLQPSSPKGSKSNQERKTNTRTNGTSNKKATDDQIVDFILTMYPSFVHPIIFMRLLIHRFRDPWFDKYFDGDPTTGQIEEYGPLPIVHIHLMRLWKTWLDKYPEQFITYPTLASELSCLFLPMKRAGGPYLPCAESLENLLVGLEDYSPGAKKDDSQLINHCHHSLLYAQCQKAIVSGGQPCQVDDAVYLSALQLYIEDLSPMEQRGRQWFFQGSSPDKLPVSRMKQSLPHSMYKVKNIVKRIKTQRERFISENLSERNAKHNYVDCCQSIAGYGCRFFKLKECQGTNTRKNAYVNRLFGINPNKVILLDEKTKSIIGLWQFKDIKRWNPTSDNLRLQFHFTNQQFEFLLDNKSYYKEITELLFNCTRSNLEALGEKDFSPWSKYAEDTETWGPVALAHETEHQIPENARDDTENGPMARSRAVSCISAQQTRRRTFQRHVSIDENYSTSAPFPGYNLGPGERGPVGPQTIAPVLAATASSISPLSGLSLQSTHHSLQSSDELQIGSLQSTPATSLRGMSMTSKGSWDASTGVGRPKRDSVSRESEGSVESSPTELQNFLDPNLSLKSNDIVNPSEPPRHRYLSTGSPNTSMGSPSPSYSTKDPSPTPRGGVCAEMNFDAENFNRIFGLSPRGQLLTCHCPPDPQMPGFDRRNFTVFQLLEHPKELARQITAIDHEYFCAVTAEDIQKKVAMGTGKKRHPEHEHRLLVERVADRFNQLTAWVVASILTEESPEKRATIFINFIETAKQCLEFRNFNAVMAIVAALGSAPIRRLGRTKEFVPKEFLEQFSKIEMLMDAKDNYKRYRSTLRSSPTPTIPYFGIYMKDLTFIAEGNADFLKGGLVNLNKRRLIYLVVNDIRKFQKKSYNFQEVTEIREFLLDHKIMTEDDLYLISRELEPTLTRRHSEPEKDSRSSSIPQLTRSNTVSIATGKALVKSLSLGEDSKC